MVSISRIITDLFNWEITPILICSYVFILCTALGGEGEGLYCSGRFKVLLLHWKMVNDILLY